MKSSELREKYIAFFEAKDCKRWPSSSLVPDDPSMLLTSAGMVQFKPYFLQQRQLETPYIGAVSVQKCVRTTDIDIIGTTGRHLSFFEMLGNFSFGEYFKSEMCAWAYEFSTEILGFDPERLYFSVYLDDEETVAIWRNLGVPESHIVRLGAEDNFWQAGPTGPCGPCSELYYDHGEEYGCGKPDCAPGCDCDRFVEFWNCVFTQYDRQEDGELVPLPKKNIDTGMGLERTVAILQGVKSNYETDILRGLIKLGEELSGLSYGSDDKADLSLRICADHARAVSFMIADGILPSNEKRGFVLRRLLRRAVRHGLLIGIEGPFLGNYVDMIIAQMGAAYPELIENRALIESVVKAEEERFNQTLHQGQSYLDEHIASIKSAQSEDGSARISGTVAFELHDTYGFPIDLTVEIAAEHNLSVDLEGFETHMSEQKTRARTAANDDAWGSIGNVFAEIISSNGATEFLGYEQLVADSTVLAIAVAGADDDYQLTSKISSGQKAQLVLDRTPFYGEKGGQIGDSGEIVAANGSFNVSDCKVHENVMIAHVGSITEGEISVGDKVSARVDSSKRRRIERNHTATHLLHEALQEVLGEHVKQAGSLVAADRLRFDFTHFEALSDDQLSRVEKIVNTAVMNNEPVHSYETTLKAARADGVTALFGEKYGDVVRVLTVGENSRELCGGTHVKGTAEIGFMKIISESSVGASVRRIEAVTSFDALKYTNKIESELKKSAGLLKTMPLQTADKIEALQAQVHALSRELKQERASGAADVAVELAAAAVDVGYNLVIARLDDYDIEALRRTVDLLRDRLSVNDQGAAMVFGAKTPANAPVLLAAANPKAVELGFDAAAVIKQIAPLISGGGGGKAQMAQAGGKDLGGLDAALDAARDLLTKK